MKKIVYVTMIALAGIFASCDDILDVESKSSMNPSDVYSTEVLANAAVMGIHQSFGETNSYRGRFIPYYGLNTDCEWFNNSTNGKNDKEASLCVYTATSDNTYMNTDNNAWAKLYEAVERANRGIKELRRSESYKTDSNMAQLLGELLTLRAVVYFDLIKAWGDVPFRTDPVDNLTIYLPKTDRMIIMDALLLDLEEAGKLCAWPNDNDYTKSTERVSKSFAKGLRARIAMFCAGYSQYPTGIKRNTDNPDKYYQIAKDECLDVINNGPATTLGAFKDNFEALCKDDVTAGKESLWEIPFSDGRGRVAYTFAVKHTNKDQYTKLAKGGVNGPLPTLFYDYDKDDIRRNITCVPYVWTDGVQIPNKASAWCFGKLRFEWMSRVVSSSNDDGINFQYMRLADVYLMAAEAINELENGPTGASNAAQYLKPILDRAYPEAKAAAILTAASAGHDEFFETIVEQRKFEFAGEMLRKVDLIRWNMLGSKLAEAKADMKALAERTGKYANLPENIYYRTLAKDDTPETGRTWDDTVVGETVEIYGLEQGDTDDGGKALTGYSKKTWLPADATKAVITENHINSLYIGEPDKRQFWPIWQVFISSSNGFLTNDYDY